MGTVIVEQFNPRTQCWNKLFEVDEFDYDADASIVGKYGGPFRTRIVGGVVEEVVEEEIEDFEEDFGEEVREEEKSYSWE